MALNVEQLEAKAKFLSQENALLREALLDAQIKLGEIKLSPQQPDEEE